MRETPPLLLTLAVSGYRSLRDIVLPLGRLNVVTGPNGSGKSSLYRAIRLIGDIAHGRIIGSLAAEGGLQSTLWAGPASIARSVKQGAHPVEGTRRKSPVALKLGFASEDYGYAIDLGLPLKSEPYDPSAPSDDTTAFFRDPEIKVEAAWIGEALGRHNGFAQRHGPAVELRLERGQREIVAGDLAAYDSMMTHGADPRSAPELLLLRDRMRAWRFYDHFRSDREAPARIPQVGTRTTVLGSDGADFAAAMRTIVEIGDREGLHAAVEDAFPKSRIEVVISGDGLFEVRMHQHGLLRPLRAAELSDGTLRYLLLTAALLSPRAPALLVLNEPESSLHPDLYAPLGRLIAAASERTQVIVVTHAAALVETLAATPGAILHPLRKEFGETLSGGTAPTPHWVWPQR